QTGSYIGYSFAVPSNIAKKVVDDIMEFGDVQMGSLGVRVQDLSTGYGLPDGITESEGVLIGEVFKKSGAFKAGVKAGDIIKEIDHIKISKFSDLIGYLRSKRPNDKVELHLLRDGESLIKTVELLDNSSYVYTIEEIGISVQEQTQSTKDLFKGQNGVVIFDTNAYNSQLGLKGKLLVGINDEKIKNIEDVKSAVANAQRSGVMTLVFINQNGERERLIYRN